MNDIAKGERIYQEFLEFRDKFLTKAMKEASAYSTNMYGETFRPVVIVPERTSARWEALIKQWEEYAEALSQYPELGFPVSLYKPTPQFITGANRIRCHELPAVNSQTVTREKVIREIESLISRVSGVEDTKEAVSEFTRQLEMVRALPPKTKLRVRRMGYTDLVCSYNTAYEKDLMLHVTASGVFFDDRVLRYGFQFGSKKKVDRSSVYDVVQPLPLTVYRNAKVYLVDEVERVRAEMKAEREANAEKILRERWARSNEKRRASKAAEKAALKGATASAGEQNPSGGAQE